MILNLSYPLNESAFGYGNGERFHLKKERDMCCGDTSNNSSFKMPTHYGTHIDFPFHFSSEGKNSSAYPIEYFIFNKVEVIELSDSNIESYLIRNKHLNLTNKNSEAELLIIKTGFCNKRTSSAYWEYGLGFHRETAGFLKNYFPNLRAIAFDLISLNSFQNREEGRAAHKEFLITNDVLIIEEVDLRKVTASTQIKQAIVAPLNIENADGAPVTIIAAINE
jgi:kynurenine formamidase